MNPYMTLPRQSYWRTASGAWRKNDLSRVYAPKTAIDRSTKIATAGSCFAQHIARALRGRGYRFMDVEPAPDELPEAQRAAHGYGLFSARYGNIYSTRQLLTLVQAAFGARELTEVWEKDGRFFDPLRPTIEPGGFGSAEELNAVRRSHLRAVKQMFLTADVFVFTLGLTETWINAEDRTAYQICPGTTAGTFDPDRHVFVNLGFRDVLSDMERVIRFCRKVNPDLRFLLTVSPVPLAATATGGNVVVSTSYSKSVLRAVAGELVQTYDYVDYFPSYEIITSHLNAENAYGPDMREVRHDSVERVMGCFFAAQEALSGEAPLLAMADAPDDAPRKTGRDREIETMMVVCDEAGLDMSARQ